jgi:dGTPase
VSGRRPLYSQADKDRLASEISKGRVIEPYRSPWRIDYARLVHCPAFRRLQGKTQLFPGESDFFRNRLTHSLEVAQIAKSIAIKLNHDHFADAPDEDHRISPDLVEFAALAHDLGHPPFGHNGEAALDECMKGAGGFEGNAQTLRILSRIEKKRTEQWPPAEFDEEAGRDLRRGLNCTFRSLAAVLKYDRPILPRSNDAPLMKGYYEEERSLVRRIKEAVTGDPDFSKFKSVECQIMDIADDIAYSTYDLEDAMKVGFTSPLDFLRLGQQPKLLRRIAVRVWKTLEDRSDRFDETNIPPELQKLIEATETQVLRVLVDLCRGIVPKAANVSGLNPKLHNIAVVSEAYNAAKEIQENGYLRTSLTSQLVGEFIRGVSLVPDPDIPALSKVKVDEEIRLKIEVLKRYTFESHIEASRLKTVEFRGKEIVSEIFNCLKQQPNLLPKDWRARYDALPSQNHKLRCICDFAAGMTDRYALEFFHRLKGDPVSIFKDV